MSEFKSGPLSPEQAEAERDRVYDQVSEIDFSIGTREPYTAEDIFEKDKFNLSGQEEKTIFDVYAYDENAKFSRWEALGFPGESFDEVLTGLQAAIKLNEIDYNATPAGKFQTESYSDILTDATTWKGEKVKIKMLSTLQHQPNIELITKPVAKSITGFKEEGFEVDYDILSTMIFYEVYGVTLDNESVPQNIREAVEALLDQPESIEE